MSSVFISSIGVEFDFFKPSHRKFTLFPRRGLRYRPRRGTLPETQFQELPSWTSIALPTTSAPSTARQSIRLSTPSSASGGKPVPSPGQNCSTAPRSSATPWSNTSPCSPAAPISPSRSGREFRTTRRSCPCWKNSGSASRTTRPDAKPTTSCSTAPEFTPTRRCGAASSNSPGPACTATGTRRARSSSPTKAGSK